MPKNCLLPSHWTELGLHTNIWELKATSLCCRCNRVAIGGPCNRVNVPELTNENVDALAATERGGDDSWRSPICMKKRLLIELKIS